jgi:hypothetical protein
MNTVIALGYLTEKYATKEDFNRFRVEFEEKTKAMLEPLRGAFSQLQEHDKGVKDIYG